MNKRLPLVIATGVIFALILLELAVILSLNGGQFTYTLDDAYIHLALSENIRLGHYGLNVAEYSAPASSILWPFLLALLPDWPYVPLVLNIAFALGTLIPYNGILNHVLVNVVQRRRVLIQAVLLIMLALGTNLVGLVFNGMEHALQLMLTAAIAWGLIKEVTENHAPVWLYLALVLAPAVRFENLILSAIALAFLTSRRRLRPVFVSAAIIALVMAGFSAALWRLNLGILPTSVIGKAAVVVKSGQFLAFVFNLIDNIQQRNGLLLALGMALLKILADRWPAGPRRRLVWVPLLVAATYLIGGKVAYQDRYEIYVWSFVILFLAFYAGPQIGDFFEDKARRYPSLTFLSWSGIFSFLVFFPYLMGLVTIPLAANNVYEQHFQMHRFAVDFYDKPVAVNDVGLVAYGNDNLVLDLSGMASPTVWKIRRANADPDWMTTIPAANQVELAMIYDAWFSEIPATWIKLGELRLSRSRITPSGSSVAFYATNAAAYADIQAELARFVPTLPEGTVFVFTENTLQ